MESEPRGGSVPGTSPPPKIKVVYILGSSRSGSTTLDTLLGASGTALSTGEMGHLHWSIEEGHLPEYADSTIAYCSCGALVPECPVWSRVIGEWGQRHDLATLGRETNRFETVVRSIPSLALGRLLQTPAFRQHLAELGEMVRTVARIGSVSTIIDSTKVAGRGWLYSLLPSAEFDVRFVHLVRDGPSVVSSMMRHYEPHKPESGPSPWPGLAAATFSTAHWVYMNLASSFLGAFHRPRYLRLRFEDLLADPARVMDQLEKFLDLDLGEARRLLRAGEPFPAGHVLCGNRTKAAPLRVSGPTQKTSERLALGPSLVFLWLAGWLQWAYGEDRPRAAESSS